MANWTIDDLTEVSPDGGIGRRVRLKIWLSQGSAGSIPVPGTKKRKGFKSLDLKPFLVRINFVLLTTKYSSHC